MSAAEPPDDLDRKLDEVAAMVDQIHRADPETARARAVASIWVLGEAAASRNTAQQSRVVTLFEQLASSLPSADRLAQVAEFGGLAARYVQALMARDTDGASAALAELIRRADAVPAEDVLRPYVLMGVASAYLERHSISGDLHDLELAGAAIDEALAEAAAGGPFAPGTQLNGHLRYVRGHLGMIWGLYDPGLPRAAEATADLEQAAAMMGPAEAARCGITAVLETARVGQAERASPSGPGRLLGAATSAAFERMLDTAEQTGHDAMHYPMLAAQAAAGLILRGLSAADLALVDQGIALLAGACAMPVLGLRVRPRLLHQHGYALHTRYSLSRDPRDLGNAIARLEEARRAVEQELGSPYASSILLSLAEAYRSRSSQALGDVDRALRIGLDGLREHASDVLLQDSDDNALLRARQGSSDATEMARWFLSHGREEAAIGAIELGRGMVLHAATSDVTVAEALAAEGQRELAERWAERPGRDDARGDDLRYQARLALAGSATERRLLSPPTIADITTALARSGAEALVYLLAQEDSGPGIAVLVERAGTVRWLPLPRLRVGPGSPVDEFLQTRLAVEHAVGALPAAAARTGWLRALDAVCDWAWQAAIGPLLRAVSPGGVREAAAAPPRLVLVATGELGLIPWHAARRPGGRSSAHYACRDAVFSYASSARQFIAASGSRVRPWAQTPVLISDRDRSLFMAAVEVEHLHAAHYSAGEVYGSARSRLGPQVPGGPGASREDVLAALPHGSLPGASLLHFGCHGQVGLPALESRLVLGRDGNGEVIVSVRDILRQARAARVAEGDASLVGGGLVVLAACVTDVAVADYDEALTLAAAFLAAGCSGVVAAKWMVADADTALFMAAFHRSLNAGHGDPSRALREAQLWMLDPDREVPGSWLRHLRDEACLDGHPEGPRLASVESWAGFTYQGR